MSSVEVRETFNFFFYGTLCHPAILLRVLRRKPDGLQFQEAILHVSLSPPLTDSRPYLGSVAAPSNAELTIQGYTRHHVKNEDYPAVVGKEAAEELLEEVQQTNSPVDFSTRGTLVKGLSYRDVHSLDVFEGNQYTRRRLPVTICPSTFTQSSALPTTTAEISPTLVARIAADLEISSGISSLDIANDSQDTNQEAAGGAEVGSSLTEEAWVYVWSDDVNLLEPKIWDFQTFVQEKADVWTGATTLEYDEVDHYHAAREEPHGREAAAGRADLAKAKVEERKGDELDGQRKDGFPDFGHGMLKYWSFKEGYLNFNNGSYGAPPTCVVRAMRQLSDECESRPDFFMKQAYRPHLREARQRVADLIGAGIDEVVIVPGTSHGINNVLREIDWADGDIILSYNTTYGAVAQTMRYLADRNPTLTLEVIHLDFPVSHAEIVRRTEEALEKYNLPAKPHYSGQSKSTGVEVGRRIRGLVIDQIASMPGMVFPMDSLVRLCKKYGVLSIVDAAHSIGQVATNVKDADPDFWVSNCHKWLFAHRACAVLYVPIRNQGLIRSSMPTGHGYESERYPTPGVNRNREFASQYDWVATQDWAPFFSINSALDFRKQIGGEERIMAYCHALAVAGGNRLAERWAGDTGDEGGSVVMDNGDGELTAAMLNVFLPNAPVPRDAAEGLEQKKWFEDKLFEANAFCSVYVHAARVCARFSCQVWNQLEDFDRIAGILEDAIDGIRQGEHKKLRVSKDETLHRVEDLPVQDD